MMSACLTLALVEVPQGGFLIDSVLINGVDVVLRRLQGSELRAQVTVLTAVRTPGTYIMDKGRFSSTINQHKIAINILGNNSVKFRFICLMISNNRYQKCDQCLCVFDGNTTKWKCCIPQIALTCQTARSLEGGVGIQIMRDLVLIGGVEHTFGGGQSGVASHCSTELV